MKIIKTITEQEMVEVFVKGEINSPRWGEKVGQLLEINGGDMAKVLGEFRGYKRKGGLFDDLDEVKFWKRVVLEESDFEKIKYIDYDYWDKISEGTRLVTRGVENVRKGVEIFNVSNEQYWQVAKIVEDGGEFPEIILLANNNEMKLLEGHVRLTGFLLAKKQPKILKAIVGFKSTDIANDILKK